MNILAHPGGTHVADTFQSTYLIFDFDFKFFSSRVATSKSPDFPIEKYTYVKKLGDSNRAGKTYLYELQHSEAAPDLPKQVIVKTLNKRPSDDNLVILSCGNHPRIVKVYGKCTVLGQFGIVMKGFDETLESYLEQIVLTTNQQMSIPEVKTILNQLAFALQFLYKKDLLHCGIRPENIFIRKHNNKVQAALIDIGVSRLIPRIHKGMVQILPNYVNHFNTSFKGQGLLYYS